MNAWVFDVDGVLTDIQSKKVEHLGILETLAKKLESGELIGLVTGRTVSKVLDRVIRPLEEIVKDRKILDNLNFEGEFGAASLNFKNGEEIITYDDRFSFPSDFVIKGEQIINQYKDIVLFDAKKSFFTAEMIHGGDHNEFKVKQKEIASNLRTLVDEYNFSNSIEVHEDTIAVNVKNKKLNKYFATQKLISWLKGKKLNPESFYVFGDSNSDFQIGEEIHDNGYKIKFIYVGKSPINSSDNKFPIIITNKKFDEGTLEFLQSFN